MDENESEPVDLILIQCDKNPAHKGNAIAELFKSNVCHAHPATLAPGEVACPNDDACDGTLRQVEAHR